MCWDDDISCLTPDDSAHLRLTVFLSDSLISHLPYDRIKLITMWFFYLIFNGSVMEMLYAIIDIGSSSIRLAVYHLEKNSMDLLLKKKHAIGLAGFIDNDCMTQAGIDKTVEIVKDFKDFLANFPITSMDAITTAALRNCRNSRKAVSEIEERTGISLRVISGDEEATFDFIGAAHNRKDGSGLLVDIGGVRRKLFRSKTGKSVSKSVCLWGHSRFAHPLFMDFSHRQRNAGQ